MRSTIVLCILFAFLCSCTPPPIEVTRSFNNIENFHFNTGNTHIEFVKDNSEFVLFVGYAASDPTNIFVIEEKWDAVGMDTITYLDIKGSNYPSNNIVLDKIEVHYQHLHRLDFATYQPPTSLGVYLDRMISTREPIVEDSLEIILRDKHRSFMEVDVDYLHLSGSVAEIKLMGTVQHLKADFNIGYHSNNLQNIDFGELVADSCFLDPYYWNGGYLSYVRIDVNANNYLEVDLSSIVGSCTTCSCEVYYKGHPTIVNHNSGDPRIGIMDNN
jgi:hypothetical protein